MGNITIVGSDSPSTFLARGEEATVQNTSRIRRLIARGFVVVKRHHDAPADDYLEGEGDDELTALEQHADADAQKTRDELGVPPRTGTGSGRDAWAAFLSGLTPPVTFTDDAGRDDLIAAWDAYDPEA